MGSFANSVFTALFGWVRNAARALWDAFFVTGESGRVSWFAENWKQLVILLLLVCTAVDLAVYILRWRPYRVWASFLRRLRGEEEDDGEQLPPENMIYPEATDSPYADVVPEDLPPYEDEVQAIVPPAAEEWEAPAEPEESAARLP